MNIEDAEFRISEASWFVQRSIDSGSAYHEAIERGARQYHVTVVSLQREYRAFVELHEFAKARKMKEISK